MSPDFGNSSSIAYVPGIASKSAIFVFLMEGFGASQELSQATAPVSRTVVLLTSDKNADARASGTIDPLDPDDYLRRRRAIRAMAPKPASISI